MSKNKMLICYYVFNMFLRPVGSKRPSSPSASF